VRDWHEIALEANGVSFPLWLRMLAEERRPAIFLGGSRGKEHKTPFPLVMHQPSYLPFSQNKSGRTVRIQCTVYFFSVPLRLKVEVPSAFTKCSEVGGI
jgi:hypothetical protein